MASFDPSKWICVVDAGPRSATQLDVLKQSGIHMHVYDCSSPGEDILKICHRNEDIPLFCRVSDGTCESGVRDKRAMDAMKAE